MSTYTIAIKHDDDTMHPASNGKYRELDRDTAEELMEGIHMGTAPCDNWAGVAVINDDDGSIYSEMEW